MSQAKIMETQCMRSVYHALKLFIKGVAAHKFDITGLKMRVGQECQTTSAVKEVFDLLLVSLK